MAKNIQTDSPKVLGLDVSTKTIGWALFDIESNNLLELTHISPVPNPKVENKIEELILKSNIFRKKLEDYVGMGVQYVVIEEPLLNSNNVYTVGTLLRFNGMISKVVDDVLGVVPDFITSYDSRAYAYPELTAIRTHDKKGEAYKEKDLKTKKPVLFGAYAWDIDKKQIIWDKVADREPQIVWEYDKNMKLKKENFDMTDAYTCVLGHMRKEGIWK
jgi:RNase H-fold protein (predicted Holliday junction resolvase)